MHRHYCANMAGSIAILLALTAALPARARDAKYTDIFQGRKLSSNNAEKLERKLAAEPENFGDRVRLIAFYTLGTESPATDEAVKARRRHLLWMAEQEPESDFWGQWSYLFAVYKKDDRLADPEGFNAIRDQWLKHLSRDPTNEKIRVNAALFLELGDPETSRRLMREMRDSGGYLGTLYASILLGETARDHDTGFPLSSDPTLRDSALAKQALSELEISSDADLIGQAGFSLARDGGLLWSQKKLDWDYSHVAGTLLSRALTLRPNQLFWFLADLSLPQPGVPRPMATYRIGGDVMAAKLLRKPPPKVIGRLQGVHGSVVLDVAINGDGKVVRVVPQSGPSDLYAISVEAVEQWLYQPTTSNGQPVNVITSVTIDYP